MTTTTEPKVTKIFQLHSLLKDGSFIPLKKIADSLKVNLKSVPTLITNLRSLNGSISVIKTERKVEAVRLNNPWDVKPNKYRANCAKLPVERKPSLTEEQKNELLVAEYIQCADNILGNVLPANPYRNGGYVERAVVGTLIKYGCDFEAKGGSKWCKSIQLPEYHLGIVHQGYVANNHSLPKRGHLTDVVLNVNDYSVSFEYLAIEIKSQETTGSAFTKLDWDVGQIQDAYRKTSIPGILLVNGTDEDFNTAIKTINNTQKGKNGFLGAYTVYEFNRILETRGLEYFIKQLDKVLNEGSERNTSAA